MDNALKRVLNNPRILLVHLFQKAPFKFVISDKAFVKLFYHTYIGKKLDLLNPKGFNEKLQWLKLYDRKDEYSDLTDKLKVRDYVADKIGKEHLVPLLGVWDSAEQITIDKLPEKFVLKCNHDSASVVICTDKKTFNIKKAKKKLSKALRTDYYYIGREYNYHNIERKIIAEQYLSNESDGGLTDYKFFCFDGEPKFIQIDTGRFSDHIRNFYTMEWEYIDVSYGKPNSPNAIIPKPEGFSEMVEYAKVLSKGFTHVRVDFYYTNNQVYFGELTFHHGGGAMVIKPERYDELWGSCCVLPQNKNKRKVK